MSFEREHPDDMPANVVALPPGAYYFWEYSASWPSEEWPTSKEDLEIKLQWYPVVALVYHPSVDDDHLGVIHPIYLEETGGLEEVYPLPYDWGEDGIDLGTFLPETTLETLKDLARDKSWFRLTRWKIHEQKASGG
jgi:hypothetical protein